MTPPKYSVTVRVQRNFVWDIVFEVSSFEEIEKIDDQLEKMSFYPNGREKTKSDEFIEEMSEEQKKIELEVNPTPVSVTPVTPDNPPSSNQLSNIGAGADTPTCSMHKQLMDRVTKTGKPYHSYKGKNCSGDGWWGEK